MPAHEPDGVTTASNPSKASITCRAMARVVARSPELYAGWPQQTCSGGTSTVQPASSRSFTAAKPTDGRNRSTRQVTKSATRRGFGDVLLGTADTAATLAAAKMPCNGPFSQNHIHLGAAIWPPPLTDFAPDEAAGSRPVEAVEVHHLYPGRHEVLGKLLLRVGAGIDLRQGAQLRVRAEDQVGTGAGPPDLAALAVAAFEDAVGCGLPLGRHVEQVDEEVVRQRARLPGEDAVLGAAGIGAEDPQPADKDGHLGRRQGQQLSAVDKLLLGRQARRLGPQVVA